MASAPGGWRHHSGAVCGLISLGQVTVRARRLGERVRLASGWTFEIFKRG